MTASIVTVSNNTSAAGAQSTAGAGFGGSVSLANPFASIFAMLHSNAQSGPLAKQEVSLQDGSKAQLLLLSPENGSLQDFLAQIENSTASSSGTDADQNQAPVFSQNILVALTQGTPALPNSDIVDSGTVTTLSLDEFSNLVSSHSDILQNANVLLVAAQVTPANMEDLAKNISKALSNLQNSANTNNTPIGEESADALDNEQGTGLQVILVSLVPDTAGTQVSSVTTTDTESSPVQNSADTSIDPTLSEEIANFLFFANIIAQTPLINSPQSTPEGDLLLSASGILPDATSGTNAGTSIAANQGTSSAPAQSAAAANTASPFAIKDSTSGAKPFEIAQKTAEAQSSSTDKTLSSPTNTISGTPDTSRNDQGAAARFMAADSPSTNQALIKAEASLQALSTLNGQSPLANPVLNNPAATAAHPASQSVANAMLVNYTQKGEVKSQQLSLELDPPELGRVQIQLSLEKGENMKIHVLAESKDTLDLLKRDSHSLRHALESAGIKTDESTLSFDMSNDGSAFQQAMAQQHDHQNGSSSSNRFQIGVNGMDTGLIGDASLPIDTTLGVHIDEETGAVRYNILA